MSEHTILHHEFVGSDKTIVFSDGHCIGGAFGGEGVVTSSIEFSSRAPAGASLEQMVAIATTHRNRARTILDSLDAPMVRVIPLELPRPIAAAMIAGAKRTDGHVRVENDELAEHA